MTILRGLIGFLVAAGVLVGTPLTALTYSGGAPAGFAGDISGSSGPQTCAVCHATNALNSGSGSVSIQAPGSFAPGETVQITVSVDNQTTPASEGSRRQGFEAAVKDPATGEHVGTLQIVDAADTHFAQGNTSYVTHTSGGTAQTSWTFAWTAPASGVPTAVRIYAAGNAADGNGSSSGDHIYTATADLVLSSVTTAEPPDAVPFDLGAPMPNPFRGGRARLDLVLDEPGIVSVRLVDGLGRLVRRVAEGEWTAGAHPIVVPVEGLAPGLYFVVAEGERGARTQPLSVVR